MSGLLNNSRTACAWLLLQQFGAIWQGTPTEVSSPLGHRYQFLPSNVTLYTGVAGGPVSTGHPSPCDGVGGEDSWYLLLDGDIISETIRPAPNTCTIGYHWYSSIGEFLRPNRYNATTEHAEQNGIMSAFSEINFKIIQYLSRRCQIFTTDEISHGIRFLFIKKYESLKIEINPRFVINNNKCGIIKIRYCQIPVQWSVSTAYI